MAEIFENATCTMTLRDDGILDLMPREGAEYTEKEISALVQQKMKWSPKKLPLLVIDPGEYATAAELFTYSVLGLEDAISAVAYYVQSDFDQTIAEIKTDLIFKNIPSKIFLDPDEAAQWLMDYR